MSADRFHVFATNDVTSVLIATKYTLGGALIFATELLDTWVDVHVREYQEGFEETPEGERIFKVVAKLSNKGLIF